MFIHAHTLHESCYSLIIPTLHSKSKLLERRDGEGWLVNGRKVPVAFYSIIIIFHPTPHYGCWQRDIFFFFFFLFLSLLLFLLLLSIFQFSFSFSSFIFWHKHTYPFCLMLQLLVAHSLSTLGWCSWKIPSLINIVELLHWLKFVYLFPRLMKARRGNAHINVKCKHSISNMKYFCDVYRMVCLLPLLTPYGSCMVEHNYTLYDVEQQRTEKPATTRFMCE